MSQIDRQRQALVMAALVSMISTGHPGLAPQPAHAQSRAEVGIGDRAPSSLKAAAPDSPSPDANRASESGSNADKDPETLTMDLQAQKDNLFVQWLFIAVSILLAVIAFAIWMSLPPGKNKKTTS